MDKIINLLINNWTKGVDTYTHNGSTWLIFTEQRSWVIELTESKTLWYNYNFFKELFSLTSMDVVDNQHYITKWVEDNVINKVKDTILEKNITEGEVEEIIENGVRHILNTEYMPTSMVEDIIQSGVKHTEYGDWLDGDERLDDIIENGVKKTSLKRGTRPFMVKDTIKNGVKETNPVDVMKFFDNKMEDALQNGIKETKTPGKDGDILSTIEWMEENKSTSYTKMIDDVIDNGTKNPSV
jgi:hypothetical protein